MGGVVVGGVVVGGPTDYFVPTRVEVELGCDNNTEFHRWVRRCAAGGVLAINHYPDGGRKI